MSRIKQVFKKIKEKVQSAIRAIANMFSYEEKIQVSEEEAWQEETWQEETWQEEAWQGEALEGPSKQAKRYHTEGRIIYLHDTYRSSAYEKRHAKRYEKGHKDGYRGGGVIALRSRAPTRTG